MTSPRLDSLQPATLPDLLERGLRSKPDEQAVISVDTRWTWRELDTVSSRLAASLIELGLASGDRIASLLPNRPALLVYYLACFKAGFVATPLNYRYMAPEIDHALSVSRPRALLSHAERDEDLAASELADQLPIGRITYGAPGGSGLLFEELVADDRPAPALPPPEESAAAAIFFTSGSTGPPKGVTHTQRTLGWLFANAARGLELGPDDVLLAGSSLSHIGGFYVTFGGLSAGAAAIIARTFDGDELLPLLREDRPTVLSMLPSALFALTRDHGARHSDFGSLRLCRAAGDKVSRELEREFTHLSGRVIDEAYGMTEMGLMAISPPSGVIKIGSVGRPVPGVRLVVRTDDGQEVPAGGSGRLWARSDAATVGYWDDPPATAEVFRDGWLDTGDVMESDKDGYLYFCGRKKQILVHDGSNICPQEIEEVLVAHPSVQSAGVIGIHDAVHGENVRAYVVFDPGANRPTSQELIQFCRAKVGYKAPEEILPLDEIPLNASGKLDRAGLIRMAESGIHGEDTPAQ
jgi:long-chain acyl-CoA synthetase